MCDVVERLAPLGSSVLSARRVDEVPARRRGFRAVQCALAVAFRRRPGGRCGFGHGSGPRPAPTSYAEHERPAHQDTMFLLGEDERTAGAKAHSKVCTISPSRLSFFLPA